MVVWAIIPARYASSRFPGKPLVKILGKPMIQHVYEAVHSTGLFNNVVIATDHEEIFDCVDSFGGNVEMTEAGHVSGTDRIWEVVSGHPVEAVVNVQGDEPLIDGRLLAEIRLNLEKKEPVVSAAFYSENEEWFSSPDHVKVVLDKTDHALYFSRSSIPYFRDNQKSCFWHHIGIYGYRKEVLEQFVLRGKSFLEDTEKLEQLRLLENGFKIKIIKTQYQGIGVDRPQDVDLIEKIMKERESEFFFCKK